MAPAITRAKQRLALSKPEKPAKRSEKHITRPIISKTSKIVPKPTPKSAAASAPKPTKPPSSIPASEQPTSSNKAAKPASAPPRHTQASPGLSSRNAASASASTSSKPRGMPSKSGADISARKDVSARKAKKNDVRKHAARAAEGPNSQLPMDKPLPTAQPASVPLPRDSRSREAKKPQLTGPSQLSGPELEAMMERSKETRRRSNPVDSGRERKEDVEMGMIHEGEYEGEEEEGQNQQQKKLEGRKPGQKRQKNRKDEDDEVEEEEEETRARWKRQKEAEKEEEEEEEEEEERQEDTNDDVDDLDMDDGSVQADRDGNVLMEEDSNDDEDGQEELDDEMDDLQVDMDDGSAQMDREGNVTMHDVDDEHQTPDGSLQEDVELEESEEEQEENGEDTDMIPESERGDEVGNGGQSDVEEGSDAEWEGLKSPGSVIDDEEEDGENEPEEIEPEWAEGEGGDEEGEGEQEWADGGAGDEEEGENEDEGEEMEVEEGENEDQDEEMDVEEGAAGDSVDTNADADAPAEENVEQDVATVDEEGNNDNSTSITESLSSADEKTNATIYKTVKELIQNIPSKHFVYCRALDQPNDIQHLAFKAYDVEGAEYRFDTRNLQNDPEDLARLLGVAGGIYKKQYGWEYANLKRDFTFFMTARRGEKTTKAKPKTKKKATKGKPKTQGSKKEQALTYKGHITVADSGGFDDDDCDDGGDEGGQWDKYIQRLAEEALDVLGTIPKVTFKPELEFMWVWGEKSLFSNYDFPKPEEDKKLAGRLMVILAGLDYEGGEFAFSCENRCHYFDPKAEPCLIATLRDGSAYVDALPLTSGYRIGLVYQLRVSTIKMAEQNTAMNAVNILNDYEKKFLDGLATWGNRVRNPDDGKRNGIHRTVYYILKKQLSGTKVFEPSADLTPAQKLQLAWLYKLCRQMPGKRIGDEVYDWLLHVDLAVLSCRTMAKWMEKDGTISLRPGFEVEWTADADIETDDWNRNESEQEMEVKEEAVINFGEFGSSGLDEYLCIRLNIA